MGGFDWDMDGDRHRIVERFKNGKWRKKGTVSVGNTSGGFYAYSTVTMDEFLYTFGRIILFN